MQVSQNLIIMKIKLHATVKIGEDKTCNLRGSGKKSKSYNIAATYHNCYPRDSTTNVIFFAVLYIFAIASVIFPTKFCQVLQNIRVAVMICLYFVLTS